MNVLAMRVIDANRHPQADALWIYQLEAPGRAPLQVIANGERTYAKTDCVIVAQVGVELLAHDRVLWVTNPYVFRSDEFSLGQLAVYRGTGNSRQTIEAGWQRYPSFYGDSYPHLFTYLTTVNDTLTKNYVGGYNETVLGFMRSPGAPSRGDRADVRSLDDSKRACLSSGDRRRTTTMQRASVRSRTSPL